MTYGVPSSPYASSNGLYKSPIASGMRPTSAYGSGNPNWTPTGLASASGGFGRRPSINSSSAYTSNSLSAFSPSLSSLKSPGAGNYGYNTSTTTPQSAESGFQKPSYLTRPSSFASLPTTNTTTYTSGPTFSPQTPAYQSSYQSPFSSPQQYTQQKPLTPSFARPSSPAFGGGETLSGGGAGPGIGAKTLVGPYRPSSVARQW